MHLDEHESLVQKIWTRLFVLAGRAWLIIDGAAYGLRTKQLPPAKVR